jgi:hypothetical protein
VKSEEAFIFFFFSNSKGKWQNRFDHINFGFGRKSTGSGVSRDALAI